ncbi:hypothetical protein F4824DRAFT_445750 [Ustulina deusta]|nr:hypothetical protein F4824DRAFT_445750 [Ustulina deusta]
MFLHARLVLDYLSSNIFFTGAEMRSSIDELPEELSELCVLASPCPPTPRYF